ncbi:hypothetical protein BU23DRAFT_663614 [Bimuria novae-zelandiae CBS 107.79]|uniref:DNA2/NAM7 helicase-like C-terminal domain-containing protein n=1 Tax=Bimuria novae-zelandiae CBS 107.79 TaxID=1447943 RepID=A0A6A5UNJ7_9PLEO|nr:hypothetical protein BU23DRAFT_663614 [Bimuria novae-zelandiae CBS 107.79]
MLGKDLTSDRSAQRKAQKRIKGSCLIFTTCIGASLGLLRTESFEVVIVDEASQQTEPASLVPLVKGCSRAILVGDHVQLRAIVQKHAVLTGYDVSVFERHYNLLQSSKIAKVIPTPQKPSSSLTSLSIAILTPYTRQEDALAAAIPGVEVSSIDGYQGREADIVVFVTVRCNTSYDMGFLTDIRRLNVVMMRAKVGVVIIGNKQTLTGTAPGADGLDEIKLVWGRLFESCGLVTLPDEENAAYGA